MLTPMDLFALVGTLRRPRRAGDGPNNTVPLVRPRLAEPPAPVAPGELVTANPVAATLERPDLGLAGEAPVVPMKEMVAPDGMTLTRPRVADPVGYHGRRLDEMATEAPRKMGRGEAAVKGLLQGFGAGGLGGALFGVGVGALNPDALARARQREEMGREGQLYAGALTRRKAEADLAGDEVMNEYRAAQIPYMLARPELAREKEENLNEYRGATLGIRREANESLEDYRNRTLGLRQDANESLEEYRERIAGQGDRRITETERHNRVGEAQGGERIGLQRESLKLRERIASGNLDARWAAIGRSYDGLDERRQQEVDDLATKAAKAEAEADYFAAQPGKEAEAKLKRGEAEGYFRRAQGMMARGTVKRPAVNRPAAPQRQAPKKRQGGDPLGLFN